LKIFLCFMFKSTAPNFNFKWRFHCVSNSLYGMKYSLLVVILYSLTALQFSEFYLHQ
jgi:hypothetical protein